MAGHILSMLERRSLLGRLRRRLPKDRQPAGWLRRRNQLARASYPFRKAKKATLRISGPKYTPAAGKVGLANRVDSSPSFLIINHRFSPTFTNHTNPNTFSNPIHVQAAAKPLRLRVTYGDTAAFISTMHRIRAPSKTVPCDLPKLMLLRIITERI